jgi:hypothetical protein
MPDPIALPIINPSYEKMGREAVKRVRKYTGLDVKVVRCPDSEGFKMKLRLDELAGNRPVLFFDCDYWMLQPWDLRGFLGAPTVMAVHDSAVFQPASFVHQDCLFHGLDWQRYINTGAMCLDFSRKEHRDVMILSRQIYWRIKAGKIQTADNTDQFAINAAMIQLGTPQTLLPIKYNFYSKSVEWGQFPFYPRDIVGIHAAGYVRDEKLEALKREAAFFERNNHPMLPGSVNFEFHRWFDLR